MQNSTFTAADVPKSLIPDKTYNRHLSLYYARQAKDKDLKYPEKAADYSIDNRSDFLPHEGWSKESQLQIDLANFVKSIRVESMRGSRLRQRIA